MSPNIPDQVEIPEENKIIKIPVIKYLLQSNWVTCLNLDIGL